MQQPTLQAVISLIAIGSLTTGLAGGPAIGIAMASGSFQIDRSEVKGNASLFDGSELKTTEASSKVRMNGGARLELGTGSLAKVYASRLVLEKGSGQLAGPSAYGLEARRLRITTEDSKAIARVQLDGAKGVYVSAVNGPVRVSTLSGVLVASLLAGRNMSFEPQAAGAAAYDVTGCVLKKSGQFIIVDQATSQVFELHGMDLTSSLGNRLNIKGTSSDAKPMAGAAQVIQGQSSSLIAPGGCLATASSVGADPLPGTTQTTKGGKKKAAAVAGAGAAGAGTAAGVGGAAAGAGLSTAAIAGIVVAAGAGGTVAAVVVAHSSSNKSQ